MFYEFKKSTEKVELRIHPEKTKILSNQSIVNSGAEKELEIGCMRVGMLTRSESVKYMGQKISFHHQETTEIKKSNQGSMGDIPQIQTRVDIEKLHAQSWSTAIRRRSFSDNMLRSRNMESQQRARNNDSINATQDVTAHHSNRRKIQKYRDKKLRPTKKSKKRTSMTCAALMMKAVTD